VDSDPGIVDVTYVDAAGATYTDVRAIGYGSAHGNQTFLFDVARMTPSVPAGPGGGPPSPGGSPGAKAALFHTLTPCRMYDSRNADGPAAAAPVLAAGEARLLALGGRCGVPITAVSLSVNVTAAGAQAGGALVLYPGDESVPLAGTVAFRAGQTRSNNALIKVAGNGSGTLGISNGAPGQVHFLLDVNGWFE
jgi:hypothetical protein